MITAGVLYWVFVVFAATSAPERERACGSYGADVVDIFAASFRDSITCRMAATGWTKSIRGPEKRMTTRMRSRMSGL